MTTLKGKIILKVNAGNVQVDTDYNLMLDIDETIYNPFIQLETEYMWYEVENVKELQDFVNRYDDYLFVPDSFDYDAFKESIKFRLQDTVPAKFIENDDLLELNNLTEELIDLWRHNKDCFFSLIANGQFSEYVADMIEGDYLNYLERHEVEDR